MLSSSFSTRSFSSSRLCDVVVSLKWWKSLVASASGAIRNASLMGSNAFVVRGAFHCGDGKRRTANNSSPASFRLSTTAGQRNCHFLVNRAPLLLDGGRGVGVDPAAVVFGQLAAFSSPTSRRSSTTRSPLPVHPASPGRARARGGRRCAPSDSCRPGRYSEYPPRPDRGVARFRCPPAVVPRVARRILRQRGTLQQRCQRTLDATRGRRRGKCRESPHRPACCGTRTDAPSGCAIRRASRRPVRSAHRASRRPPAPGCW